MISGRLLTPPNLRGCCQQGSFLAKQLSAQAAPAIQTLPEPLGITFTLDGAEFNLIQIARLIFFNIMSSTII